MLRWHDAKAKQIYKNAAHFCDGKCIVSRLSEI